MFNDPNEALEQWYCLFNNVLDIHMPFKTRRVKIQHQPETEWFSASISSAIKQRNNLHRQAVRYNTELHWREYRLARNQVVHLIRKAKRDFYRNYINCNLDNPKNLWKIIRNLAPSQCSNLPSHLLVDGIIYDSHIDIANLFNAHFVNIASSVVPNKNASTTPNWGYLKDFVRSKLPLGVSFTTPPITSVFGLDSLRHLPTGKAVGLDGLTGYFLKLLAPSIASSLTTIFNLSLSSSSFPDLWKKAKVSPLFKDGSLFDRSNYRLISVLAILSKILERHVHISFYNSLTENDLLSDSQFGFRKSRSCELAVTDLIDRLLNNMDTTVLNELLLVDLKKAFDLVNHTILLSKLHICGCSFSTLQWFASYLCDQLQRTNF